MSARQFVDRFGDRGGDYAAARPSYPRALLDAVVAACPGRGAAWDCATGTGQVARPLAGAFARVIATDRSPGQLAAAESAPRLHHVLAAAEAAPLCAASLDLVTVAQALHWFDRPAFYREAERVLRPGGVLAVWCYGAPEAQGDVAAAVRELHDDTLAPFWPPERRDVLDGYRGYRLPFPELPARRFTMAMAFSPAGLLRYLGTWSAVAAAEAAGQHPLDAIADRLADREDPIQLTWPVHLRLARPPAPGPKAKRGGVIG